MRERILVLDGATGTYLQHLGLTEADYRGTSFKDNPVPLKGCNDVLCLTRPDVIRKMHLEYISAGADIIETNSFNCNRFSLADYGLEDRVYEIGRAAASVAASCTAGTNVFVAGSIGPTNRTASISADVADPAAREVSFAQLADTYSDCVRGLIDGGADLILVETIFDTLNAKAALMAVSRVSEEKGIDIPVMISGTLADASGRTLSGQTVEAFAASLLHANPISIGLNCAFGASQLKPWLKRLAAVVPCPVSVHPNAGLPNVMGEYDETPEMFVQAASEYMSEGLVNIFGGCCGTTPEHIRKLAGTARAYKPRPMQAANGSTAVPICTLSGLEPLRLDRNTGFVNIGERTNVAGSAQFRKLIQAGNYEEALTVARNQVDAGAQVIDICMDDGLIDGVKAMTTFLNLVASEPEIARVPVMIDSSRWEILEAGLQCIQGKGIVNSISLKEGEEVFLKRARYIHSMGAAAVVMLFDEQGQAGTYERKIEVAHRAYGLLRGIGFPGEDIIFDANVLSVATGMPEHDDYGRAFIEACRTIHSEMPEVHMSGGISNLSFSFRGNNPVRQAMHSVFLYHAIRAGLDMSIVNPAMLTIYDDIPEPLRTYVEDVILNRQPREGTACENLIEFAQKLKEEQEALKGQAAADASAGNPAVPQNLHERISHAMLKGIADNIGADVMEAYNETGTPLGVIDGYLMPAMEHVGKLFSDGRMFLPQVVKSARVMKKAVAVLEPYMLAGESHSSSAGTVVMATVKGDVHDIGKNIAAVVTQCNGYTVRDLGVMAEPEAIVSEAQRCNADVIGLSGLITPSLAEMTNVVRLLEQRGLGIPVIVGGATTSALHTAVRIAPEYPHGFVISAHAAADNPGIIRKLLSADRDRYILEQKAVQQIIRDNYYKKESDRTLLSLDESRSRRFMKTPDMVAVPSDTDQVIFHVTVRELIDRINWAYFYQAWDMKGDARTGSEGISLKAEAERMLADMDSKGLIRLQGTARIMPAISTDNDEIVIDCDGKDYTLPFPRSLNDSKQTDCLADHIMREGADYICPFVVTAGVGLKELQEQYRKDDDEYHAIMAKLLCDRLAEAFAGYVQDCMQKGKSWGNGGIRMAFGYGACPDHSLKLPVIQMLKAKDFMDISLTDSYMISPGESVCGLIFANTPTRYFTV